MSILHKVEKLIRHEVSARQMGSLAEADAFAAKARQILTQHQVAWPDGSAEIAEGGMHADGHGWHPVTAAQAGIGSLKTRQEWTERLAEGIAGAFHCQLLLQCGSNTVVFRGQDSDRLAAAQLYAELARKATDACAAEFAEWKQRQRQSARHTDVQSKTGSGAYSRRWKQSFLIGFAQAVCQRFLCGNHCMHACRHASSLVRIGDKPECRAKQPMARAIGGMDLLYDAVYRGQAKGTAIVLDLDRRHAA